jgi:hypothetical protein
MRIGLTSLRARAPTRCGAEGAGGTRCDIGRFDMNQREPGTASSQDCVSGSPRGPEGATGMNTGWLTDSRLVILGLLLLSGISVFHESPLLSNIASGLLGFLAKDQLGPRP